MPVVGPHPVGWVRRAFGFEADTLGRRLVLRMPIQAVVVAPAAQMEKAAGGAEKFECRRRVVVYGIKGIAKTGGPGLVFGRDAAD